MTEQGVGGHKGKMGNTSGKLGANHLGKGPLGKSAVGVVTFVRCWSQRLSGERRGSAAFRLLRSWV
jgi:hypothetical protein